MANDKNVKSYDFDIRKRKKGGWVLIEREKTYFSSLKSLTVVIGDGFKDFRDNEEDNEKGVKTYSPDVRKRKKDGWVLIERNATYFSSLKKLTEAVRDGFKTFSAEQAESNNS